MGFSVVELIKRKKFGAAHSREEIAWLIDSYTKNEVYDYQMSAWAMAVWFKGMNEQEIAALVESMRDSGKKFDFKHLNAPRVDKHSTGGVGDKTSLIIAPIMAAAKVHMPMIAGRGLGHTGGTVDKLESIPGFSAEISLEQLHHLVTKFYVALMGQTEDICPADKKLYALRDVTATVDSLPLITGSIMCKKLAEDLSGLVLDVKFGSGAFMKSLDDAEKLARQLKSAGEANGVKVTALLTNMNEPLGRWAGNAFEVKECLDILSNKKCIENNIDFYESTRELSLILSGHMLFLAGKAPSVEAGYQQAQEIVNSGAALAEFKNLVLRQKGSINFADLVISQKCVHILATQSGYIENIDTEAIGMACVELGAGRKFSGQKLDLTSGIEVRCRLGQFIREGSILFSLYCDFNEKLENAKKIIINSTKISPQKPSHHLPLVLKVLG